MCILYFDRERAKVVNSALYTAALERRMELEIAVIIAISEHHRYSEAIAALDRANGAWAIGKAFEHLAEITPSSSAWR